MAKRGALGEHPKFAGVDPDAGLSEGQLDKLSKVNGDTPAGTDNCLWCAQTARDIADPGKTLGAPKGINSPSPFRKPMTTDEAYKRIQDIIPEGESGTLSYGNSGQGHNTAIVNRDGKLFVVEIQPTEANQPKKLMVMPLKDFHYFMDGADMTKKVYVSTTRGH